MALSSPSLNNSLVASPSVSFAATLPLRSPSSSSIAQRHPSENIYHSSYIPRSCNMQQGNTGDWPATTVSNSSLSSSATNPAGYPSDYGSFPTYDNGMAAPYGHIMYSAQQFPAGSLQHPAALSVSSRPPLPTHRQHFSTYSRSASPTMRHRIDLGAEYSQGLASSQYPSPGSIPAVPLESDGYTSPSAASGYLSDVSSAPWGKHDFSALEPQSYPSSTASPLPPGVQHSSQSRAARTPKRQTRKLTTKEDANFQCEVPGCGKLFSRSYNYKAHMATHNEHREYPFPCLEPDCNKKFVRKTDLQRHNQSVHTKERSHKCDYCSRMFARKDTLRRHMDDGCSKRFDIETVHMQHENQGTYRAFDRPGQQGSEQHHALPPHQSSQPGLSSQSIGSNVYAGASHQYPNR